MYYDPRTCFSGMHDLKRKTGAKMKDIREFLEKQDVYTLHKPILKTYAKRRVQVSDIDEQFQADLIDMQKFKSANNNVNYALTVIDVFSKKAWAIPIQRKTGSEICEAFRTIFAERIPLRIQTDKGTEFINKDTQAFFKKHGVTWFTTQGDTKCQIVERWNRTLKTKMWKYFTANNTRKWIDVLPKLVENYNTSYHRSIKMTPNEASLKKNKHLVFHNLYGKIADVKKKSTIKSETKYV